MARARAETGAGDHSLESEGCTPRLMPMLMAPATQEKRQELAAVREGKEELQAHSREQYVELEQPALADEPQRHGQRVAKREQNHRDDAQRALAGRGRGRCREGGRKDNEAGERQYLVRAGGCDGAGARTPGGSGSPTPSPARASTTRCARAQGTGQPGAVAWASRLDMGGRPPLQSAALSRYGRRPWALLVDVVCRKRARDQDPAHTSCRPGLSSRDLSQGLLAP